MGIKKKSNISIMLLIIVSVSFIVGCTNSDKNDISALVTELKENVGYDVEYNEEKNTIRITDYISKDTIIEAVSKDSVYNQWNNMKSELEGVYDSSEKLGDSKGLKDISYEVIIIDKESSNTDEEVPLLIINETGIVFDMVEQVRNE